MEERESLSGSGDDDCFTVCLGKGARDLRFVTSHSGVCCKLPKVPGIFSNISLGNLQILRFSTKHR